MTTVDKTAAPRRAVIGELLVAGLVAVIAGYLLVGAAVVEVPATAGFLGPRFFPTVVGAFLLAISIALVVQVVGRARRGVDPAPNSEKQTVDVAPLAVVLVTLVAHVLLLEVLGWIIAGALLFWGVSYALGGRRLLRDLGIAFVLSAAAQLGFSAGLGLSLPSGILLGVI